LIWADGAYRGDVLARWCATEGEWRLKIITGEPQARGFVIRPWCWIVERTLAWIGRQRRLSKDYERKVQTSEMFLTLGHDPADGRTGREEGQVILQTPSKLDFVQF
jgi:transposase